MNNSKRLNSAAVSQESQTAKPLGAYLVEAGLLTPGQVEVALNDQKVADMRFGEVLATRGWVKQQTIDYLMEKVVLPERQGGDLTATKVLPQKCFRASKAEIASKQGKTPQVSAGFVAIKEPQVKKSAPAKRISTNSKREPLRSRSRKPLQERGSEPTLRISWTEGTVSLIKPIAAAPEPEPEKIVADNDYLGNDYLGNDDTVSWVG